MDKVGYFFFCCASMPRPLYVLGNPVLAHHFRGDLLTWCAPSITVCQTTAPSHQILTSIAPNKPGVYVLGLLYKVVEVMKLWYNVVLFLVCLGAFLGQPLVCIQELHGSPFKTHPCVLVEEHACLMDQLVHSGQRKLY